MLQFNKKPWATPGLGGGLLIFRCTFQGKGVLAPHSHLDPKVATTDPWVDEFQKSQGQPPGMVGKPRHLHGNIYRTFRFRKYTHEWLRQNRMVNKNCRAFIYQSLMQKSYGVGNATRHLDAVNQLAGVKPPSRGTYLTNLQ